MTKQLSLRERWALDGEMLTEAPYTLDAQPRWITDDLADVYGPDADAQPGVDELPEDDEEVVADI